MPDLAKLLNPASLAVIGASEDTSSIRGHCCETLLHHRWSGRIHLVSRSSPTVFDRETVSSIDALPEIPDLALLLTPAPATARALLQCAALGVPAAIVVASGFADGDSTEGRGLQEELAAIARDHDMALSGPNGEGFADIVTGLAPTFSPVLRDLEPLPEAVLRRGPRIAVVAQSGALGFGLFDTAWMRGLNVTRIVTTGNEAVLTLGDYVAFLAQEGRTDAILLFAEGFRDGCRFLDAAASCRKAGVPLVMLRVGRSSVGQRQAASHTGALAADDRMVADLLSGAGVIEASEPEEAVEILAVVAGLTGRRMAGNSVGICSSTGGGAGLLADLCERDGLDLPSLLPETRETLDALLPSYASTINPVDSTAAGIRALGYSGLARTIAGDDGVGAVIVAATGRTVVTIGREKPQLLALVRDVAKPVVFWSYTTPIPAFRDLMSEVGLPFSTQAGAITRALAGLARLQALPGPPPADAQPAPILPSGVLTEARAYPLLEELGLNPGAWRLVTTAEEACEAARVIGGPVALKVQSLDIPHKTEAGGVRLSVTADTAAANFDAIIAAARLYVPDAVIDGVLVQAMAASGVEVMVGAFADAVFGPVVMVGAGGVYVEISRDVAFATAPVDAPMARAMVDRLRLRPLLDGARGEPPADVGALAQAIVAVSRLAMAPGFQELDLNPVFVHEQGLTVADALIICGENQE